MMFLKRIASEIRRGENIDLYVTIIVTPLLVILTITGVTQQSWIAPLTITVLALLAANMLVSRHRLEDTQQQINFLLGHRFLLDEFPAEFDAEIKECKELWILGINAHAFIANHYALLQDKLASRHLIRVLIMDPDGKSVPISLTRSGRRVTRDYARKDILSRLSLLCDLKEGSSNTLEIRTIDYPIAYGAYLVNPHTSNGAVYLKHYGFKMMEYDKPKMVIRSSEGEWFDFYKSEIQNMWDTGKPWNCETRQRTAQNRVLKRKSSTPRQNSKSSSKKSTRKSAGSPHRR